MAKEKSFTASQKPAHFFGVRVCLQLYVHAESRGAHVCAATGEKKETKDIKETGNCEIGRLVRYVLLKYSYSRRFLSLILNPIKVHI